MLAQTDGDWEWVIVDDCSRVPRSAELLREVGAQDARIRTRSRTANGGIVAATNDALNEARGEFLVMLDHDDELEVEALACVRDVISAEPDVDYVYSDEAVWDQEHGRYMRIYKPGWSPEWIRCQNYANHLSVFRRSLVEDLGGWREGFDGAQDHDLLLRIAERTQRVRHIPKALYRWNVAPGSTVGNPDAKPYAFENGLRAVEEHWQRLGVEASVEHGVTHGVYRSRRALLSEPMISILIPTNAPRREIDGMEIDLLERCVDSLFVDGAYPNVEVLIVPDPETDREALERARSIEPARIRILPPVPRPFNFSRKINWAAAHASGEYLLLLNDDVVAADPAWLRNMLSLAQQDDVGAVGAKLLFEDGSVQHAGVFIWHGPSHIGLGAGGDDPGYLSMYALERDCIAVTGACLLTPREVFDQVGGLWLGLPGNWNDVDYCLKVRSLGKRIVWTPSATLTHYESVSRDPTVQPFESLRFASRWARELAEDPFFSPAIMQPGPLWPGVGWR